MTIYANGGKQTKNKPMIEFSYPKESQPGYDFFTPHIDQMKVSSLKEMIVADKKVTSFGINDSDFTTTQNVLNS